MMKDCTAITVPAVAVIVATTLLKIVRYGNTLLVC